MPPTAAASAARLCLMLCLLVETVSSNNNNETLDEPQFAIDPTTNNTLTNVTNSTNSTLVPDDHGNSTGVPGNHTPGNRPPSNGGRSPVELVRDIVIILLAGLGVVLGLLILTYLLAVFFDRFCCCFPCWTPLSDDTEIDTGRVARNAGLYGLTRAERMRILEHAFEKTTRTFESSSLNTTGDAETAEADADIEAQNSAGVDDDLDEVSLDISAPPLPPPPLDNANESGETEETEEPLEDDEGNVVDDIVDADHATTCCICLSNYETGDQVMTGTVCKHLLHYDCSLQWLEKHDGCPYCRKPMIRPSEMRETALTVLGERRVALLSIHGPNDHSASNEEDASNAEAQDGEDGNTEEVPAETLEADAVVTVDEEAALTAVPGRDAVVAAAEEKEEEVQDRNDLGTAGVGELDAEAEVGGEESSGTIR